MALDLTEEDRRVLAAVMDRLIPAVDHLPAAGAMGLPADVERMAGAHGRYAAALAQCLKLLADDARVIAGGGFAALPGDAQDAVLSATEQAEPKVFATVLEAVYIAYYSRPEVHKRIGWRTGPLQPAGFELPPFDERALEGIRRRAPFWRKAP